MKKFCRVFALLAVMTMVAAGCAFAADKIAVVNSQFVLRNHPRADQTLKRLEAMMRAKQQEAAKEAEKATDRDKKAQIVAKKQREAAEEERKLMQPLEKEIFAAIINELLPEIKKNKAALYINIGDYINVWEDLRRLAPDMYLYTKTHINDWEETKEFCADAIKGDVEGIHLFCHENIFEAVYATNLLMRSCDVLVTKPSELAFYPVPKLFIKRIGGHEQWGAIHSAEMGDGSLECQDIPHTLQMARLFLEDDVTLKNMCDAIDLNKKMGVYDGAYNAVKIAMGLKGVTL